MVTDILNLIHRLQSENEGLKERGQTLIDSLHKTIAEQKAEIERLTEERNQLALCNKGLQDGINEYQADNAELGRKNAELQKQVDEYKAKIEQGTLIELPCKVGDTVYETDGVIIYEHKVDRLIFTDKFVIYDTADIMFDERAIGKSIFLTREEAEKRLKEL